MNTDQLLDVASYAGKLLIESGAEIYRVEETMVRLCKSFPEVEDAQSFVTTTGIMFSITVAKKTHTKILRVHTRGVDLNCIDKINSLSRETAGSSYT
ncbi:threonine/serine exporter family protein, partial [[Clostridium] innocuum]|nr:threonine/serine exporter family protein [[Clostridium] innocuum]